jgi:hypothetical protein
MGDENEGPKPAGRKRDMKDWAKDDIHPSLPTPADVLRQKKGKKD